MEATGVDWIPLFQLLEDRGFEICLPRPQIRHEMSPD